MGIIDNVQDFLTSGFRRTWENFEEDLKSNVRRTVHGIEDEVRRVIYQNMKKFSRMIMKELMGMLLILISMIFFAVAAVYFLIEYVNLSRTISLLIVGAIILVIGLIIKMKN